MKVLVKSAWGSDDPTKAAFPFLHANASSRLDGPRWRRYWSKLSRLGYRCTSEGRARGPVGSSTRIWTERTQPLLIRPSWCNSSSGLINC